MYSVSGYFARVLRVAQRPQKRAVSPYLMLVTYLA